MELSEVPVIGTDANVQSYRLSAALEAHYPGQDAENLMYACQFNTWGPLEGRKITGLLMVQQGENDARDWIWLVQLDDVSHWWAVGGRDYTGWDCMSDLAWTEMAA